MEFVESISETLKAMGDGLDQLPVQLKLIHGIVVFCSVSSALFSGWSLIYQGMEAKRKKQKVKIILSNGGKQFTLPWELRRGEISRAEILGVIGMIQQGQRFSVEYLNTSNFLDNLTQAIDGSGEGKIIIPCNDEEYSKFKLPY